MNGNQPTNPNAETVKLLNCPFCGAQPWDDGDSVARRVGCLTNGCCLKGYGFNPIEWQRRQESDELKRLRDELQTANTEIDMLRDTLSLIEQSGGRYSHDELGMSYNGSWCAEQARRVLEETK